MPDYTKNTIDGYVLYFTSKCVVEAFHAHSSKNRRPGGSAKIFIREDGSVKVEKTGDLPDKTLHRIINYIGVNYKQMYRIWVAHGGSGYYRKQ